MKRPGALVRGGLPPLGHRRDRQAGLGVVLRQALHQGHDNPEGLDAVGIGRIEVVRLGEIAEQKCLGAVAPLDGGFPPSASGQPQGQGEDESELPPKPQGLSAQPFGFCVWSSPRRFSI